MVLTAQNNIDNTRKLNDNADNHTKLKATADNMQKLRDRTMYGPYNQSRINSIMLSS